MLVSICLHDFLVHTQRRASRWQAQREVRIGAQRLDHKLGGSLAQRPIIRRYKDAHEFNFSSAPIESTLAGFNVRLPFIQAARPILLQQSREGAIRKQTPVGLARGAVVAFVFCVDDVLDRRTTDGARFAVPPMNSHLWTESRDL